MSISHIGHPFSILHNSTEKKERSKKCTNEVVLFADEVLDLCGDIDRGACHIWQRAVSTH